MRRRLVEEVFLVELKANLLPDMKAAATCVMGPLCAALVLNKCWKHANVMRVLNARPMRRDLKS